MADKIRKVEYFAMNVPNKPGEAAWLLEALSAEGVNLLAFTGFPAGAGKSQVDFVPQNAKAFKAVARRAGMKLRTKKGCFHVQGGDRPGAVARVLSKLGDARINVTAVDAVCGGAGRYGAILWVKPKDAAKAAKVLRAR
jgi:hypothetical protein